MAENHVVLDPEVVAEAAETCACFNFRKAARAVTQLFDEKLQPTGLRSTQLVILLTVARSPSASIAELARDMVMERSTLTRNLKPLEAQGLVRSQPGRDRRMRLVKLTARGRTALAGAVPYWRLAQRQFVGQLGAGRWDGLRGDLAATVEATRAVADS